MDSIDRAMKEADRLGFGVSYGKYQIACLNGMVKPVSAVAKPKQPEKPSTSCRNCGRSFVPNHANEGYCSEECRYAAFRKRQNDYYKGKSRVPSVAMCEICGADFKPLNTRSKYCSEECAKDGARKTAALWRARRKKGAADGVSL